VNNRRPPLRGKDRTGASKGAWGKKDVKGAGEDWGTGRERKAKRGNNEPVWGVERALGQEDRSWEWANQAKQSRVGQ